MNRKSDLIRGMPSAQEGLTTCKECVHRPTGTGVNHDITFPDTICPCQCLEDPWYSWMPNDDWFCADGTSEEFVRTIKDNQNKNTKTRTEITEKRINAILDKLKRGEEEILPKPFYELVMQMEIARSLATIADVMKGMEDK